jgi:hypothetical protein
MVLLRFNRVRRLNEFRSRVRPERGSTLLASVGCPTNRQLEEHTHGEEPIREDEPEEAQTPKRPRTEPP